MAAITLKNIVKTYGDGFPAVNDVSLDIEDGELMILVGPSGAGRPVRRARLRPRRRAPGPDADRDLPPPAPAWHHHRLRHPRPDRGHDAGRPGGRAAQGPAAAGGHGPRAVRASHQPVRD